MSLRISGKHMNIGDALSRRIEDRIDEAIGKYFDGGFSGQVTIEKSVGGFDCDCSIHLDTGVALQANGRAHEAGASFEEAAERIEKRLRRYKRRLKDHHNGLRAGQPAEQAPYAVMTAPPEEDEVAEDFAPAIVAEMSTPILSQTVAQAVVQLDLTDKPVVVFANAATGRINVVYRRPDGNVGWIDPSKAA